MVPGEYTEVAQGNVIINTENVTLKNTKISGDLIIGDGTANSDITLDQLTISGRLVVRGGGSNCHVKSSNASTFPHSYRETKDSPHSSHDFFLFLFV